MTVDQFKGDIAARDRFVERRDQGITSRVPNLGSAAFAGSEGVTVTLKDDKVLTVDTRGLPRGNDRPQISQSLSFEILSCWTG